MRSFLRRCALAMAGLGFSASTYAQVAAAPDPATSPADGPQLRDEVDTRELPDGATLPETGFQWGLAVAFGLPLGKADGGASLFADTGNGAQPFSIRDGSMSGLVSYHVPLALDLGYRLSPTWWIGLRPQAATGGKGDQCPTGATCFFADARVSALAKYHFAPHSSMDPWLGLALGWEWLFTSLAASVPEAVDAKQNLSGPLLQALGGLAFDLGGHLRVGPFASAAVGRYVWNGLECSEALGCPDSYFVRDGGFHAWLSIGISGDYGP